MLRIDAHCDFSPEGWDVMMEEVTGEKDLTVAVLTAIDKQTWERLPGHWYGFCKLMPNMEAKWQKPNRDHLNYRTVEPNMACTGCGIMLRRDFYYALGGADESLPPMGGIGEEFAVKTWAAGGKVQTRTDVMIGHIFGTSKTGYPTQGVTDALKHLEVEYGHLYPEIKAKFPDFDWEKLTTAHNDKLKRTVTVNREDTTITKDSEGNDIKKVVEYFKYVWLETDEEKGMTEDQIRIKYAPLAAKIGQDEYVINDKGEWVKCNELSRQDTNETVGQALVETT
jgi:hypothetical protein